MNKLTIRIAAIGWLIATVHPVLAINDHYTEAATCEFPTSLHIGLISSVTGETVVLCSGVYVGSGLMLTAAHCAIEIDQEGEANVYFGEDWQNPIWSGSDVECVSHPDGRQGEQVYEGADIAYCKLDSGSQVDAWPEPPIIPVMVPNSCENDYIRDEIFSSPPSGTNFPDEPFGYNINKIFGTAAGVGFNDPTCELTTDPGCNTGIKRYVDVPIRPERYSSTSKSIEFNVVQPDPIAVLEGDSGGPLFFRMADNSWRLIGIASSIDRALLWNYNSSREERHQDFFLIAWYTGVPRYVNWIGVTQLRSADSVDKPDRRGWHRG